MANQLKEKQKKLKKSEPQYYFKFGMYLSGRFRPLVDCHLLLALCKL